MAANTRFGWHSGTVHARDGKFLGDLYVQDDIVFSDVSAGTLGVTGGIDMSGTTSAIGIDMGGTYATSAINIDGTCTVDGIKIAVTPSAATAFNGINTVVTTGMNTTGNVAGSRSYVTSDDTGHTHANLFGLVARASLLNASDTCTGTMTGLLCQIDLGAVSNSNSANAWGLCVNHIETGTRAKIPVGFIRFTDADYAGSAPTNYLFDCGGTGNEFPTGTGKILYEHTLWIRANSADKYIVLSDAENCLSLSGTVAATPISVSGNYTTGISLSGDGTTGMTVTNGFSGTNMLSLAGTGSNAGVLISGACGKGVEITGSCTTGIGILTGTFTTGISVAGTTTTGIDIGACTTGLNLSGAMTTGISIPVAAATTCAIAIGAGISSGMPMTSTKNGLVRAFGEIQATEALTNDIRGGWFRVRQNGNCDVTGGYSTVGLQGTFKMYGHASGTTTTLWNASGVYGSFESDGVASSNVASGGLIAGVYGQLGLLANFTIDSGAIAAAVAAMSNCNSSATATGSFAGVYIGRAIGSSAKAFTTGLQIEASSCTTGISIGTCTTAIEVTGGQSTFGTYAAPLTLTDTLVYPIRAGALISSALASNLYATTYNTMAVTATQTNDVSVVGSFSELYYSGTTNTNGNSAAIWGNFEIDSGTVSLGGASSIAAAIWATITTTPTTITNNGVWAGFLAHSDITSGITNSGTLAAFSANKGSGKMAWQYGMYFSNSACTTGIYIGTCTTGISLAGAATTGIGIAYTGATASAKAISTAGFTLDNANLTDGYGAVECDLTLTGISAGHSSCLSAWVNQATGTMSSANIIAAQTNGIWAANAVTRTGSKLVVGMRMNALIGNADAGITGGETVYLFSVGTQNNGITAVFDCSTNSDLGVQGNAGTALNELIPFTRDAAGNMRYVKLYSLA